MQPTGTVSTTLIEERLGIIPVKFNQEWFQRRSRLNEKVNARTDALTLCELKHRGLLK